MSGPGTATQRSEVVIVGGGPAGLALAVALAQAGIAGTVLEQQGAAALEHPAEDGREIALTHRSRRILEALGIWARLPADEIAPLAQAHVRDGVSPLVLPFDAHRDGQQMLGWLVPNFRIREAAHAAAADAGVKIVTDAQVAALEPGHADMAARTGSDARYAAPLVVAADSRFSSLRRMGGIGAHLHDFGRTAIVCRMSHERAHEGIAHECFRYQNTLAILPMAGLHCSAVVTVRSDHAAEWLALGDAEFAARVQSQFESRLGTMSVAARRHSYPLVGVYARRFAAPRFALVGDAAVGMHPVTAHGYNFGLYGVEVLARELAQARHGGGDLGAAGPLAAYEREHQRVTLPIYLGTNAIVQLFTDDRAPARLLRGTVLRVARRLPPLKAVITRQLTGGVRRAAG